MWANSTPREKFNARHSRFRGHVSVALAIACVSAPALAETLRFNANLLPVAGTGSNASGNLVADYDTDSKEAHLERLVQGRRHLRDVGELPRGRGRSAAGMVRLQAIDSPFEGSAILGEQQAAGLLAGEWSIVVRTAGFPKGELRGQLVR